jgi:hypothetical protein
MRGSIAVGGAAGWGLVRASRAEYRRSVATYAAVARIDRAPVRTGEAARRRAGRIDDRSGVIPPALDAGEAARGAAATPPSHWLDDLRTAWAQTTFYLFDEDGWR